MVTRDQTCPGMGREGQACLGEGAEVWKGGSARGGGEVINETWDRILKSNGADPGSQGRVLGIREDKD